MIDLAIVLNVRWNVDPHVPIHFIAGTWLVKLRVGNGELKCIRAILFLLGPSHLQHFVHSLLFNGIWWRCTTLFRFGHLDILWCDFVWLAMGLLNWWCWKLCDLSLLKSRIIAHFFTMFNLIHFDNSNTFTNVGCAS